MIRQDTRGRFHGIKGRIRENPERFVNKISKPFTFWVYHDKINTQMIKNGGISFEQSQQAFQPRP